MRRAWFCLTAFAAAALLPAAVAQPAGGWATLKGQVVFPGGKELPKRAQLVVNNDPKHCLSKGPILDDVVLVNGKSRGVKNVVVWLRPNNMMPKAALGANEIHPGDQQRKAAKVEIDQPCCMFTPRVTLARVGDTIVVKNPAPVPHNFFWTSGNNGNFNPNVPPGQTWEMPQPLAAESSAIPYKCTFHPWMSGTVRVFDHPYYALTDEDGRFTMPNAPAGTYRLMVWHEKVGFLGGPAGRFGTPIVIAGPVTDLPAIAFPELAN
jgi:plastocyanin